MEIEQVEVTKLSWSKHIDITVAKMGEKYVHDKALLPFSDNTVNKAGPTGPSFYLLTTLSTRQVLQALVSTFSQHCQQGRSYRP